MRCLHSLPPCFFSRIFSQVDFVKISTDPIDQLTVSFFSNRYHFKYSFVTFSKQLILPVYKSFIYRVFIKYCVFSKILKYIPDSGLSQFPLGVSVCTQWQGKHQHCRRTGRVKNNNSILRKNTIFNEHPVFTIYLLPLSTKHYVEKSLKIWISSIHNKLDVTQEGLTECFGPFIEIVRLSL